MKKLIFKLAVFCGCLFLTGCVSVPEKTVTFTVPEEDVKIFTPKNLDALFARYHFSAAHTPKRSWHQLFQLHFPRPETLRQEVVQKKSCCKTIYSGR